MSGINLLPWREEIRRVRDRRMVIAAVAIWLICASIVFAGFSYLQAEQEYQKKRNQYLTMEISKLNKKIKEIEKLRSRKANLISRMEVIQGLQRQRTQVIHLFDDLVNKLPDGVYFNTMQKKGRQFSFTGTAQSNARVSNLMDRLESSAWFANPWLKVINVKPAQGVRLSQFQLRVSQQTPKKKKAGG
jgi:type IV pilus assembly protein PilN